MDAREEAGEMLQVADRDFRALQGMMDASIFDDEVFGFHAQQAVEKSLKAWITLLDQEYPFTHDIGVLLRLLTSLNAAIDCFQELELLSAFAMQIRYSTSNSLPKQWDRKMIIEKVRVLMTHVEGLINR